MRRTNTGRTGVEKAKRRHVGRSAARGKRLAALAALCLCLGAVPAVAAASTWNDGDVFAGVGNGSYNVYDNAGTFKETISDGLGGFTTGCAFNNSQTFLFTTNFSAARVPTYTDAHPHTVDTSIDPGAQGGGSTESIVFDKSGNFYVSNTGGNGDIQKWDSSNHFVQSFDVPRSDWIDLAKDQKTIFFTTEGRQVFRYDVGADTALPDFATLPGSGEAYALRLLPPGDGTGGLLVADGDEVKRLDGSGAVVATYDAPGEDSWFSLNLDPNGTSFWSGGFSSNNFYRFNIATGAIEVGPITAAGGQLFGLCVKGEQTAAKPPSADLSVTQTDSPDPVNVDDNLTYSITVKNNGPDAAAGVKLTDPLPAGVDFVSATPDQGSCSGTSTVTCDLGSMANGATSQTEIVVTPRSVGTGTLSNTATVDATTADDNGANDSATETTTVKLPDDYYEEPQECVANGVVLNGKILQGADGNETFTGSDNNDQIMGGRGNDTITGLKGDDCLFGQEDNDTIKGDEGKDVIQGNTGNDKLKGNDDDDTIDAGGGADKVDGGSGMDSIKGRGGTDKIKGGADDDVIRAGGSKDKVKGNAGDDMINGGNEDDKINDTEGRNTIKCGKGVDKVITNKQSKVNKKDCEKIRIKK